MCQVKVILRKEKENCHFDLVSCKNILYTKARCVNLKSKLDSNIRNHKNGYYGSDVFITSSRHDFLI